MTVAKDPPRTFSLDELCVLADLPRRTVRYYIQLGLVARPEGETRAARYLESHLQQLLTIRKWTQAGMSLESIRAALDAERQPPPPGPAPRRPGAVEVWSHVLLAEGVELMVEPGRAGLSPEQVRDFMRRALAAFDEVKEKGSP